MQHLFRVFPMQNLDDHGGKCQSIDRMPRKYEICSQMCEVSRMNSKAVNKIKKKIRKMHWYDRIDLMDWMNRWYSDMKEQQRMEEE